MNLQKIFRVQNMAVTEIILQKGPEMSSPLPYTTPRRDPVALATSIASLSQANGMPPEQVASIWALQKGPQFVNTLLETPTYRCLSDTDKARVRIAAARAVSGELIDHLQLTAPTRDVHDKRWGFWNAGYSVL